MCKQGRLCRQRHTNTQAIILARDYAPEFTAGNVVIDTVPAFRYLGRRMTADDSDAMAVSQNILKARMRWGQLCRVLTRRAHPERSWACSTRQLSRPCCCLEPRHGP